MNTEKTKICSKCKKEKPTNMFYKDITKNDWLRTSCKECTLKQNKKHGNNQYDKDYYAKNRDELLRKSRKYQYENKEKIKEQCRKYHEKNKEKIHQRKKEHYQKNKAKILQKDRIYRGNNKDKFAQRDKKYYLKNIDKRIQHDGEYYKKNKERISERNKKYWRNNKEKINERERKYKNKRYQQDIGYRLKTRLRWRVWSLLDGKNKSKSTMELLGCNIEEFKKHLESQFTEGMSFDNYGEWELDHRIPCNTFNLTKLEEQQICFHFSNIRPLLKKDNRSRPHDGSDIGIN